MRLVAATNRDLAADVRDGRFREDLYYRLNVVHIEMPPLRARASDILLLAGHFLRKFGSENGKTITGFSTEALTRLTSYGWPGNVRELENVIERAVVLCTGTRIGPDLIPEHVRKNPAFQIPHVGMPADGISLKDVTVAYERQWIESALEAAGGVQKRAAELLRIKPTTLNEMIKRYDIRPRRKKASSAHEPDNGNGGAELYHQFKTQDLTGFAKVRVIDNQGQVVLAGSIDQTA